MLPKPDRRPLNSRCKPRRRRKLIFRRNGKKASREAPAVSNENVTAPGKSAAPASEAAIAEAVEEIRFYLANGMAEEAHAAFRKLEQLKPEAAKLQGIRAELEAAQKNAPMAEAVSVEVAENAVQTDEEPAAPAPASLDAFVSDLESSLGDGFLPKAAPEEFAVKAETEPVQPSSRPRL